MSEIIADEFFYWGCICLPEGVGFALIRAFVITGTAAREIIRRASMGTKRSE